MMGRQVLGAVPVERRVPLFAALNVAGHPQLEGRTIAESFRPGAWRVLSLDTAAPGQHGLPDLASTPAPETWVHDRLPGSILPAIFLVALRIPNGGGPY